MQSHMKITDLNLTQWDYVTGTLPINPEFKPLEVRVSVTFELTPEISVIETEMSPVNLAALMVTLAIMGMQRRDAVNVAKAALTPDALPDHLEQVRNEADPSRSPQ